MVTLYSRGFQNASQTNSKQLGPNVFLLKWPIFIGVHAGYETVHCSNHHSMICLDRPVDPPHALDYPSYHYRIITSLHSTLLTTVVHGVNGVWTYQQHKTTMIHLAIPYVACPPSLGEMLCLVLWCKQWVGLLFPYLMGVEKHWTCWICILYLLRWMWFEPMSFVCYCRQF